MLKNKNTFFILFFLGTFFISNFSFGKIENNKKILSSSDIKIYKKIFEIQKLPIKNKKSNEWKKVDKLIKKLNNKILLGNVYAERYLHPTGWRSSYSDLKKKIVSMGVNKVDYIKLIDLKTLKKPRKNKFNLFYAFYIGKVRIIDNF